MQKNVFIELWETFFSPSVWTRDPRHHCHVFRTPLQARTAGLWPCLQICWGHILWGEKHIHKIACSGYVKDENIPHKTKHHRNLHTNTALTQLLNIHSNLIYLPCPALRLWRQSMLNSQTITLTVRSSLKSNSSMTAHHQTFSWIGSVNMVSLWHLQTHLLLFQIHVSYEETSKFWENG